MQVDFLLIGKGISGTLLSRNLSAWGKTVLVIDNNNTATASRVAGGVINPVTGMRRVRSWLIDDLMPFALDTYSAMEAELGISIVRKTSVLDFHLTADQREFFEKKMASEPGFLHTCTDAEQWSRFFRFNYGIGKISHCMLIDICTMLDSWRQHLLAINSLREQEFHFEDCTVNNGSVTYNDITANSIIFCDGVTSAANPYFSMLPWSKDKGEALLVAVPGLPTGQIYNQAFTMLHWKDDLFWVGATHDWKFTDLQPSPSFRKQVEEQLDYWLRLPYTVVDHLVSLRPVNFDRKPFIGMHPLHNSVGIFNGMGTKGCSLAPFFAQQFADHLMNQTPLMPDVDIARYKRIMTR